MLQYFDFGEKYEKFQEKCQKPQDRHEIQLHFWIFLSSIGIIRCGVLVRRFPTKTCSLQMAMLYWSKRAFPWWLNSPRRRSGSFGRSAECRRWTVDMVGRSHLSFQAVAHATFLSPLDTESWHRNFSSAQLATRHFLSLRISHSHVQCALIFLRYFHAQALFRGDEYCTI